MSELGTPDRLDLDDVDTDEGLRSALQRLGHRYLRDKKMRFSYRTLGRELHRATTTVWNHLNGNEQIERVTLDTLVIDMGADGEEQNAFAEAYDRVIRHRESLKPDPESLRRALPSAHPMFISTAAEEQLTKSLRSAGKSRRTRVFLITGMPGIGKTVLAVYAGHRILRRFPDAQLYVDLRGFGPDASQRVKADDALGILLETLGVRAQEIPVDLDKRVALYRTRLHGKRVLIVLDNAYDAEQVRPLLPGCDTSVVLITSRERLDGLVCEGAQLVQLGVFTLDEARQLFESHLGRERTAGQRQAVDDLIGLCGRLPLALSVVAARAVAQATFPLRVFVAELRERGLDALVTADPATTVRTVFSWSHGDLSTRARDVFRLLGLHPGLKIGKATIASLAYISPSDVHEPLEELVRAHLLQQPNPGWYSFHDLMRSYAREYAAGLAEADHRQAVGRMLDHYLHTAAAAALLLNPHRNPISLHPASPGVELEDLADHDQALTWLKREYPVLMKMITTAMDAGLAAHAWQITWALADFFDRQGLWRDMADAHHIALEAACQLADLDAQARTHGGRARAHLRLGEYEHSRADAQAAHDLYQQLRDPYGQANTHRSAAQALEYDGKEHQEHGRDDQARALFRQALEHAEQALALAQSNGLRAHALNLTGWFHALLGSYPEALKRCTRALILHRELGDTHGEAAVCDSLGHIHYLRGDCAESIRWYSTAADLFGALDDQYKKAETLGRLAIACRSAGDAHAEREALREQLTILDRLGSIRAEDVRNRLNTLAAAN